VGNLSGNIQKVYEPAGNEILFNSQLHFSRIAPQYRKLRVTDQEITDFIARYLTDFLSVKAVDIGCGTGRYDEELYNSIGTKLSLYCIDANQSMLQQCRQNLSRKYRVQCAALMGMADCLPFPGNALNAVFSFNAVHHFPLVEFLRECSRVLVTNGYMFIYTRLRCQNRRNIWGRYFPEFHKRETRLYDLDCLAGAINKSPFLRLHTVNLFTFKRYSTLNRLVLKSRQGHYSTFSLYSKKELERAIAEFRERIKAIYPDTGYISWYDENIMFIAQKVKSKMSASRSFPISHAI